MNESLKFYFITIIITAIVCIFGTWKYCTDRIKLEYEREINKIEAELAESESRIAEFKRQIELDNSEITRLKSEIAIIGGEIQQLTESAINDTTGVRDQIQQSLRIHKELLNELEESRIGLEKAKTENQNNSSGSISSGSISSKNFITYFITIFKKLPWS